MSSVSVDASGQRALTTEVGGQHRTYASMPTKNEDDLSVNIGGCGELSVVVAASAVVKKLKKGDTEYLVLKLQGGLQVSAAHQEGMWPHASISVRKWKDEEGFLSDAEVIDVQPISALFETNPADSTDK